MAKFERKVKFLQKLQTHYNVFLNRPMLSLIKKIQEIPQRMTEPRTKFLYNQSFSKFNASISHSNEKFQRASARSKSRSRRRKNISLPTQQQIVENIFENDKKTV